MDHSFLCGVKLHPKEMTQSLITDTKVSPSAKELRIKNQARIAREQKQLQLMREEQFRTRGLTNWLQKSTTNMTKKTTPQQRLPSTKTATQKREIILEYDVTFEVEDRCLKASRAVLSAWSPVFSAMLNTGFREERAQTIPLPGKTYAEIEALINATHPQKPPLTNEDVHLLLPLAREYLIDRLTSHCESYLLSQPYRPEHLTLSEEFQLQKLRQRSLERGEDNTNLDTKTRVEIMLTQCKDFSQLKNNLLLLQYEDESTESDIEESPLDDEIT